jgi:hypothetical protein
MTFREVLPFLVDYMIQQSSVVPYDTELVTNMILACSDDENNSESLCGEYLASRHVATIELCKSIVSNTELSIQEDPILNCIIPGARSTALEYVSMSTFPSSTDLVQLDWLLKHGANPDVRTNQHSTLLQQNIKKMSETKDISLWKAREKVNLLLIDYMKDIDQSTLSFGLQSGSMLSMYKYLSVYTETDVYYPGLLEDCAIGLIRIAGIEPTLPSQRVVWNLFAEIALHLLDRISSYEVDISNVEDTIPQYDRIHNPMFLFDFARLPAETVYRMGQRFIQCLENICIVNLYNIPKLVYSTLSILEACVVHHNLDVFRCIAATIAVHHPHGIEYLQNSINRYTNLSLASFIVVLKDIPHAMKMFFLHQLEILGVSFNECTHNVLTPLMNACLLPKVELDLIQYLAQIPHAQQQKVYLNAMIMTPMSVVLMNPGLPNWMERMKILVDQGCTSLFDHDYYLTFAVGNCIDIWDISRLEFLSEHFKFLNPSIVNHECLFLRAKNVYAHMKASGDSKHTLESMADILVKMNYPIHDEVSPHPRVLETWSHACMIKM